ncbi:Tpo1p [Sugiyamaella lignohabitans]|uniref:Tpo1p n=1 Tax=Sugiyamaella lignohabitans TaxID=796027 RepID=A0A167F9Q4_9ASCO|nr:Tpo1p [Sugiyamaella lignohabitans]ANB15002.1 Tpo1p [Sugiyamaella lignohabitans]
MSSSLTPSDEEKSIEAVRSAEEKELPAESMEQSSDAVSMSENQNTEHDGSNPSKENDAAEPIVIDWAENDQANPKNWSKRHRWAVTLIMASITFISPAASSMVAPAAADIGRELHLSSDIELQLVVSVYLLGYTVGPLFLSPMSEIYGRKWIIQCANAVFLVFNLACGFAQTKSQLIAFRFLTGLGGSAPLSVGGGILGDIWTSHDRGRAMSIYSLGPVLGPSLGPIAAGFIASNTTWRWIFWAISILDGVVLVIAITLFQETYAPTILKQRANKLTKETGIKHISKYEDTSLSRKEIWTKNLIRPFKLLSTQPIIQFLTAYMAFIYGLLYLILTTFPKLWTEQYGESTSIGGLNYISVSVGYLLGGQLSSILVDRLYKRLEVKNGGVGRPEFRIPLMFLSSVVLPIGLFWYGWTAQAKTHWILPNIGAAIICFAGMISFGALQIYAVDTYGRYAASALAAIACIRSACGFGFPLFAPYLYNALGYGWGNSLLAFVGFGVGVPLPIVLWRYGAELRRRSPYAVEDRVD